MTVTRFASCKLRLTSCTSRRPRLASCLVPHWVISDFAAFSYFHDRLYKICMAFSIRGSHGLVLSAAARLPPAVRICCRSCSAGVRKLSFYAFVLSVRLPSQAAVVGGGDGAGFGWPCGGSHPSTPSYNNHGSSRAVVVSSTDESYCCHHHPLHHHRAFASIA